MLNRIIIEKDNKKKNIIFKKEKNIIVKKDKKIEKKIEKNNLKINFIDINSNILFPDFFSLFSIVL